MARILTPALLVLALAGRAADAFTTSSFRGKNSPATGGAAAGAGAASSYCAQRPLPGTDAFAQVGRVCCVDRRGHCNRSRMTHAMPPPPFHHRQRRTTNNQINKQTNKQRTARLVVPPSALHAAKAREQGDKGSGGPGLYSPAYFLARFALSLLPSALMGGGLVPLLAEPRAVVAAQADDAFKIERGAASTLNSGTVKTMTRGVIIENANFEGKDLSGVSFQQSLVRDGNFRKSNLFSASFFDADLSGADFTGANMNQVNLELANMKNANLKDAIVTEAYVSGATRLTGEGVRGGKDAKEGGEWFRGAVHAVRAHRSAFHSFDPSDIKIEGSDWSETLLRKDQVRPVRPCALGEPALPSSSSSSLTTAPSLHSTRPPTATVPLQARFGREPHHQNSH